MMNRCAIYQPNNNDHHNALVRGGAAAGGEMMMDGVVCPKPRRLGLLNPSLYDATRVICRSSPRWQQHAINQAEICDSKAEMEVLDMILTKGFYGADKSNNMIPSSPPFFCGSPPSRASNPLIQDAQFGNEKPSLLSSAFEASQSSSARKNGGGNFSRAKYGQKPAAVRIEGFNCRGISATA